MRSKRVDMRFAKLLEEAWREIIPKLSVEERSNVRALLEEERDKIRNIKAQKIVNDLISRLNHTKL